MNKVFIIIILFILSIFLLPAHLGAESEYLMPELKKDLSKIKSVTIIAIWETKTRVIDDKNKKLIDDDVILKVADKESEAKGKVRIVITPSIRAVKIEKEITAFMILKMIDNSFRIKVSRDFFLKPENLEKHKHRFKKETYSKIKKITTKLLILRRDYPVKKKNLEKYKKLVAEIESLKPKKKKGTVFLNNYSLDTHSDSILILRYRTFTSAWYGVTVALSVVSIGVSVFAAGAGSSAYPAQGIPLKASFEKIEVDCIFYNAKTGKLLMRSKDSGFTESLSSHKLTNELLRGLKK